MPAETAESRADAEASEKRFLGDVAAEMDRACLCRAVPEWRSYLAAADKALAALDYDAVGFSHAEPEPECPGRERAPEGLRPPDPDGSRVWFGVGPWTPARERQTYLGADGGGCAVCGGPGRLKLVRRQARDPVTKFLLFGADDLPVTEQVPAVGADGKYEVVPGLLGNGLRFTCAACLASDEDERLNGEILRDRAASEKARPFAASVTRGGAA